MGAELSLHQPSLWEQKKAEDQASPVMGKRSSTIVRALGVWGQDFVDDPDQEDKARLSFRGAAVLTCLFACGCYGLRLAFRDLVKDMNWFRRLASSKQLTVELYFLGSFHAAAWACFSASKILRGRPFDPQGTTRALSLSAGYYLHQLVVLRSLVLHDPLMLLHDVMDLTTHTSMLRSPGTQWLAPVIMSKYTPNVWLNMLRLFRVLDFHPGPTVVRIGLWLHVAAFLLTKGLGVPAVCAWHWVLRPKPEFHQPRYLLAKLALLVNFVIDQVWFQQVWRGVPDILRFAGQDLSLHELRDVALQPLGRAIGAAQVVGLLLTYIVGPVALPVIGLALRTGHRGLAMLLAGTLAGLALSPLPKQGLPWFTNSWPIRFAYQRIKEYFSFQVVEEGKFEEDRRYLCAMFPHGFQATGTLLLVPHLSERGLQPNALGASVLFALPVLRQVLAAAGCRPAAKPCLVECLQRRYPYNVTLLVPGGIAEMFLTRPDVEHVLSDHKGFVRCALETGADLVPCYCFGNTQVFRVAGGLLGRLCEKLSRWGRISIMPFHGVWGTVVPYPHPVLVALGRPIPVGPAVAAPTKEQVDVLHERFFDELTALFHRHKHLVPGYEDKALYLGANAQLPPPPLPELADYTRSRL